MLYIIKIKRKNDEDKIKYKIRGKTGIYRPLFCFFVYDLTTAVSSESIRTLYIQQHSAKFTSGGGGQQ